MDTFTNSPFTRNEEMTIIQKVLSIIEKKLEIKGYVKEMKFHNSSVCCNCGNEIYEEGDFELKNIYEKNLYGNAIDIFCKSCNKRLFFDNSQRVTQTTVPYPPLPPKEKKPPIIVMANQNQENPKGSKNSKKNLVNKVLTLITILGFIVGVVSLILTLYPKKEQENELPKETKEIIEELLLYSESFIAKDFVDFANSHDLMKDMSETLQTNPYNVHALIMRGQTCYINKPPYYRQAILDFEKASRINKESAGPYFGLGTVYYRLAILDIVKRKLYEIHNKGSFSVDETTGLLDVKFPSYEIFPDEHINTLLLAALNEFQKGKNLRNIMRTDNESEITTVFFAPDDIDNRIKSIRGILKYDVPLYNDKILSMAFVDGYTLVVSKEITDLFDFSLTEDDK